MWMNMPVGIGRLLKLTELHIFLLRRVQHPDEEVYVDFDIRGSRPLREIYQRCNSGVLEFIDYEDASKME
jgi:hypothetical protein